MLELGEPGVNVRFDASVYQVGFVQFDVMIL
jgi:hypothetical protein